jgi:hypothetical protein
MKIEKELPSIKTNILPYNHYIVDVWTDGQQYIIIRLSRRMYEKCIKLSGIFFSSKSIFFYFYPKLNTYQNPILLKNCLFVHILSSIYAYNLHLDIHCMFKHNIFSSHAYTCIFTLCYISSL